MKIRKYIFYIYRVLPLVDQLRILIDWTVTATALELYWYFKLEDAQVQLFCVDYDFQARKGLRPGARRPKMEKCCQGVWIIAGLIALILLPILFFSSVNPIRTASHVLEAQTLLTLHVTDGAGESLRIPLFRSEDLQPLTMNRATANKGSRSGTRGSRSGNAWPAEQSGTSDLSFFEAFLHHYYQGATKADENRSDVIDAGGEKHSVDATAREGTPAAATGARDAEVEVTDKPTGQAQRRRLTGTFFNSAVDLHEKEHLLHTTGRKRRFLSSTKHAGDKSEQSDPAQRLLMTDPLFRVSGERLSSAAVLNEVKFPKFSNVGLWGSVTGDQLLEAISIIEENLALMSKWKECQDLYVQYVKLSRMQQGSSSASEDLHGRQHLQVDHVDQEAQEEEPRPLMKDNLLQEATSTSPPSPSRTLQETRRAFGRAYREVIDLVAERRQRGGGTKSHEDIILVLAKSKQGSSSQRTSSTTTTSTRTPSPSAVRERLSVSRLPQLYIEMRYDIKRSLGPSQTGLLQHKLPFSYRSRDLVSLGELVSTELDLEERLAFVPAVSSPAVISSLEQDISPSSADVPASVPADVSSAENEGGHGQARVYETEQDAVDEQGVLVSVLQKEGRNGGGKEQQKEGGHHHLEEGGVHTGERNGQNTRVEVMHLESSFVLGPESDNAQMENPKAILEFLEAMRRMMLQKSPESDVQPAQDDLQRTRTSRPAPHDLVPQPKDEAASDNGKVSISNSKTPENQEPPTSAPPSTPSSSTSSAEVLLTHNYTPCMRIRANVLEMFGPSGGSTACAPKSMRVRLHGDSVELVTVRSSKEKTTHYGSRRISPGAPVTKTSQHGSSPSTSLRVGDRVGYLPYVVDVAARAESAFRLKRVAIVVRIDPEWNQVLLRFPPDQQVPRLGHFVDANPVLLWEDPKKLRIVEDEPLRFFVLSDPLNFHEGSAHASKSTSFIGLYTLLVYGMGKMIRASCSRLTHTIMFLEMPDVSILQDLINGVFIARSMKDFKTEYVLYHRLVSFFRNPHALLRISGADQGRLQDMES
ncbi:unnamed protein product [Amoebophrya sp. A25]|nr:unnamed protein product [Amoebophrya sp. A25]|eukprot:GSA25T00012642001.1